MPEAKKDVEKKDDFLYIVRMGNRDLNGERKVRLALADLKGVGDRLAGIIVKKFNIDETKRIGELPEETLDKIKNFVESKTFEGVPEWMYNHRNDVATGTDANLISNDLEMQLQDDINLLKKIRSYRGIRHETGRKARGQRTRANGRHGLSIGVVKKREGR